MTDAVSRRTVIGGLVATFGTIACRDQAPQALANTGASRERTAATLPERPQRHFSSLGVDRFATRDQWQALVKAFDAARTGGFDLIADPDANYRHDGALMLDGTSFDGQGCTITALSDGPQVLRCVGNGWRVANMRLLGAARTRTSRNDDNGIMIGDEGGRPATGFTLENVTVDGVEPGRGVGAAGFLFNSASHGRIIRAVARNSFADGIHITNGSNNLMFERPLSEQTGDDGFAVVSYRHHGRMCHSIHVMDGISRNSRARGCSVVGGHDIVYERFIAERSAAAGAYFYGEDAFDTYGVARCRLIDPVLRGCVTGKGQVDGFAQAALIIGGRAGIDKVDGIDISRGAVDCIVVNPVVEGVGPACWAGISMHEFAIRPRIIGGRLSNLVAQSGGFRPNGLEIGGRDVVVEDIQMQNVAGIAIVVTGTASGNSMVSQPRVTGSLLRPGPINSYIYADIAPAVRRVTIRGGRFSKGPNRLAIDRLVPGRLQLINNITS